MDLNQEIKYLKGVGEKRAELLNKLGIFCISDLLEHYPRRYLDKSQLTPIEECNTLDYYTIKAKIVTPVTKSMISGKMTLFKFKIADDTGVINVTLFNQKYTAMALKEFDEYIFYGKVSYNFLNKEMSSPEIEDIDITSGGGRIKSIYDKCAHISDKMLSKLIKTALDSLENSDIKEYLNTDIIKKYSLIPIKKAIYDIHFPDSLKTAEIAKKRLVFDELLKLSLSLFALKGRNRGKTAFVLKNVDLSDFIKALPFELTLAQKKAIEDCVCDMQKQSPMSRLVQGDVGSGKTMIAAAMLYLTYKNNMQSCLMAPTEILATQHYNTLSGLLTKLSAKVCLVTGSTTKKKKEEIAKKLIEGEIDILIGTHAVIEEYLQFKNLALIITDEQHRFGVNQRAKLACKAENPHIMVMSATPIPRTLALFIYGDLDVSIVNEMPKGRIPVKTFLMNDTKRDRLYNYVVKMAKSNVQSFVVCPLVEKDDENELKSVENLFKELQEKYFKTITVDFIHGKMNSKKKEEAMQKFVNGETKVLVATTVIEVGVDVPNANIMVIENAERFGLSQLHQLRGRVGRGNVEAFCFLLSNSTSEKTISRLKILKNSNDGFEISNKDLMLRGAGDFFGNRQHGELKLKIADLMVDSEILEEVKTVANEIIKSDKNLENKENKLLYDKIKRTVNSGNISIFN
ncbi:MAG: ATP-dependent DNA helicase RecG [Clostridia bacterium]